MPRTPLWDFSALVDATGGHATRNFTCHDIIIDSRGDCQESLFVALKGPHHDGHDYITSALENGASAAIVSQEWYNFHEQGCADMPLLVVQDPMAALNDIAKASRSRSKAKIIAITGSFGKTSCKELVAHMLAKFGEVHATEHSFNGFLGVPLTLARMPENSDYAVIEMGMDSVGAIKSFSTMAKPHVALVTVTGHAHIGKLGSLQAIANAKAEIFHGLDEHGIGIINQNDRFFTLLEKAIGKRNRLTFGDNGIIQTQDFQISSNGIETKLRINDHALETIAHLPAVSLHWKQTLPAACAVIHALGLSVETALQSIKHFTVPQGRGRLMIENDITIIDESYNAGPESMGMALASLSKITKKKGQRVIAILGDMLDLGDQSQIQHQSLVGTIDFNTVDLVYCVGEAMSDLATVLPAKHLGASGKTPNDVMPHVLGNVSSGDIYLIKGSRGQWAERGHMSVFIEKIMNQTKKRATDQPIQEALL